MHVVTKRVKQLEIAMKIYESIVIQRRIVGEEYTFITTNLLSCLANAQ